MDPVELAVSPAAGCGLTLLAGGFPVNLVRLLSMRRIGSPFIWLILAGSLAVWILYFATLQAVHAAIPAKETFLKCKSAYERARYADVLSQCRQLKGHVPELDDYRLFWQAAAQASLNNYKDCTDTAIVLIQRHPDSRWAPRTHLLLGQSYAANCRWDAALAAYATAEQTLTSSTDRAEAALQRGKCLEASGKLEAAAGEYFRCWTSYPRQPAGRTARGALEALRGRGVKCPALPVDTAVAMAWALLKAGMNSDVSRLLAPFAGDPHVDCLIGVAKFKAGDKSVKANLAHTALKTGAGEAGAYALAVMCEQEVGALLLESATGHGRMLAKAFPSDPHTARALKSIAVHYLARKQETTAAEWLNLLHKNAPGTAEGRYATWQLAWQRYRARQWTEAAKLFSGLAESAKDEPNYAAGAAYWAARSLERTGERTLARTALAQTRDGYPNHYYGRLAASRLQGVDAPSPQPIPFPAITDPLSKPGAPAAVSAAALVAFGLNQDAIAELTRMKERMNSDPSWAYRAAQLYAQAGDYYQAGKIIDVHFPQFAIGRGSSLPKDFWSIYYPVKYWDIVSEQAKAAGIEPHLAMGVIRRESHFRPEIKSNAGAIGLMQIMPGTAASMAKRLGIKGFTKSKLTAPSVNVKIGCHYLRRLLREHGEDPAAALAAYNAGATPLRAWLTERKSREEDEAVDTIPITSVRVYVKHVLEDWRNYLELHPNG